MGGWITFGAAIHIKSLIRAIIHEDFDKSRIWATDRVDLGGVPIKQGTGLGVIKVTPNQKRINGMMVTFWSALQEQKTEMIKHAWVLELKARKSIPILIVEEWGLAKTW